MDLLTIFKQALEDGSGIWPGILSRKLRTCIHNLDPPSGRVFSPRAALNFLEINSIIPAKICLARGKDPSTIRRFRLWIQVFDEQKGRGAYEEYIRLVKPIAENYGGRYLVRTENLHSLSPERAPGRVIVIRFGSREQLDACLSSQAYQAIMSKRTSGVDSRAVIAEGLE